MPIEHLSLTQTPAPRRRTLLPVTLAAIALGAVATGYAMGQAAELDGDGDGLVTYTEMLMVMPDVTEAEFMALDANGDGVLDEQELAVAVDAGLIPAG